MFYLLYRPLLPVIANLTVDSGSFWTEIHGINFCVFAQM